MRIGIEAQRIFRKNKHGMDYVVLEEIRELQKIDTRNEYLCSLLLEKTSVWRIPRMYTSWRLVVTSTRFGNK